MNGSLQTLFGCVRYQSASLQADGVHPPISPALSSFSPAQQVNTYPESFLSSMEAGWADDITPCVQMTSNFFLLKLCTCPNGECQPSLNERAAVCLFVALISLFSNISICRTSWQRKRHERVRMHNPGTFFLWFKGLPRPRFTGKAV